MFENLYTTKMSGDIKSLQDRFETITASRKKNRVIASVCAVSLIAAACAGMVGCAYTNKETDEKTVKKVESDTTAVTYGETPKSEENVTASDDPEAAEEVSEAETAEATDAEKTLDAFLAAWSEADYKTMKTLCTDEFVESDFRFADEDNTPPNLLSNVCDTHRISDYSYSFLEDGTFLVTAYTTRPVYSSALSGNRSFVVSVGLHDYEWLIDGITVIPEIGDTLVIADPDSGEILSVNGSPTAMPDSPTHFDLIADEGTPVKATSGGTVTDCGYEPKYGNYVRIFSDEDGTESFFGALSEINVETGDTVKEGDVIGKVGKTGMSTGAHLHYEGDHPEKAL